ncbi:MAG: translocation/assembly module TamB, partial [Bacteroidia bacterium]|nr:translocation/assembly module TamB [Bacteroidia bacterium]
VDAAISRGGEKNITLNGKYFIKKPHDMVDATIIAKRVHLSTLGKYIEAVASNVTGLVSGKARLTGELLSPSIDGIARIQKASFLVDYLNTSYNFTSDLALIDDHIELKDVVLNDEDGRQAMVNGKVLHNNLGGLSFDVNINADEVKCLNTKLSQNELYYGKAYGSGTVDITGDVDLLKMDIAMKSERGTQINIPLSNPDEISSTNFITFINTRSMRENIKDKAIDLSGLEMNFELEVTRDADIQLIFDEKIGDVIRGTGNGNLIMEIDRVGNFNMFGDYQVHDGKYDFTLQNIIDKKFRMVQGGTIRWNGDPYEAIVNLEAIYRTKANIKDLIPDALTDDDTTSSVSSTKRVPVNLHLLITERLLNPEIKMEIKFPDIDPGIESLVYRYVDTEQEVNEQAFSLLILNRFATPDEFANTATESSGAAVSANLSEFASNQLSAWASKISPDLDIGFNYQAKDAISEEELEIYFGTRFINDRILLNGNFDVTGQENTNDIVGDFELEVLLGKEGRFRVKAFNKANNNTLLDNFESDYTQGIGLFYRKEFNKLSEAFKSNKKIKAQQNKQENQTNDGTSSNQ